MEEEVEDEEEEEEEEDEEDDNYEDDDESEIWHRVEYCLQALFIKSCVFKMSDETERRRY